MNPRRDLLGAILACVLAVAAAGCFGGDDDEKDKKKPPIGAAGDFKPKKSLVPKGDSALALGEVENYVPEGELVSDSGFRPEIDGFGFENYGNDETPTNLTPEDMSDLFGEQVCLSGEGAECELIPAAKEWMENQNEGMSGGHCQGMSVAALRMWNEDIDQEDFGAELTSELEIVENAPLQSTIAEHFVYQFLPPIVEGRVKGAPSEVLERLMEAIDNGDELYTLGVYKADGSGGHAITPFAVEDKGDGQYAILVYDNNFPGTTRAVEVDTNEETWSYVSGTNPDDLGQVYQGDAETQTLELDPTLPGDELQPCPFCAGEGEGEEGKGSVLEEDEQYTEITLGGDPKNHPHLVFTDDEGNQTGIVKGRLVQDIPDVEVVKTYATQNWEGAPEPRYRLPEGAEYTISVDGTDLEGPATASVDLVGNGLVIEIEDIKLAPGQKDEMALPGGYGITYQSNSEEEIAPNLFAGLVEGEVAYEFAATAAGIEKGSTVSLLVDQENKVVILDSTGSTGTLEGKGLFALVVAKADAEGNVAQWETDDLELDGSKEEKAAFEYDESTTPGEPLAILTLDKNGDEIDTLEVPPAE